MADDTKGERKEAGAAKAKEPKADIPKRKIVSKVLRGLGVLVALVVVAIVGFVIWVNAAYDKDFSSTPKPALAASKDPEIIKRGQYVTHAVAHCSACHGNGDFTQQLKLPENIDDVRGGYVLSAGPFGTYYPPNITPDDATGIGKMSDADLARIIKHGVGADGKLALFMSFAVGPMADEDVIAIMSYLRSTSPISAQQPKDDLGFIAKALSATGKLKPKTMESPPFVKEGPEPSVDRGRYLAKGPSMCVGCHSPWDFMDDMKLKGAEFSGQLEPEPDHMDPNKEIMAPNITPGGLLANYTEADFLDRFKKAGRMVKGSTMPWENFARLMDEDLKSIFRFLKQLPPSNRATGPTSRPKGWKG